jgi:chromosome segregation ATPase
MNNLKEKSPQEMVNDVCDQFLKTGIKPTVRLILAEVTMSSTSTVHKYFIKWKEEIEKKQQSLFDQFGFSPEFTSTFMKEINRFNIDIKQRYKDQTQDANDQRNHVISDLQTSENTVNQQVDVINKQDTKIKGLQTELAVEEKANEAIVSEIRLQLSTSKNDHNQLTNQNESLRADITKAELTLEANQEFLKEIKSQNSQLTIDNKELHSNITELNRSIASKESTIVGNDKLILTLENEQVKTATQLSNFDSNNIKQQAEITSLRNELTTISTKLTEEKEKLVKQTSLTVELRSNFEEQARTHEKILNGYEATMSGNEKLIIQLEKKHNL